MHGQVSRPGLPVKTLLLGSQVWAEVQEIEPQPLPLSHGRGDC